MKTAIIKHDMLKIDIISLIVLYFLFCFSTYMILPFLAIYFKDTLGLNSFYIGAIIGVGPLVASFLGLVGGNLSERIGYTNSIKAGAILSIIIYLGYVFFDILSVLLLLGALSGVSRCLIEPAMKALFSLHAGEKNRAFIFRARYVVICLGAICGPACGMYVVQFGKVYLFLISIGLFIVFVVGFQVLNSILNVELNTPREKKKIFQIGTLKELIKVIRDKRLLMMITAGTLVFLVFSQFDTMYPLALKEWFSRPEIFYPIILITNSILGIAFQLPISYINKKISIFSIMNIGLMAFAFSFIVFAIAHGQFWLWIVATVLFTIGETFVIPSTEILIDEIAPPDKKGSYHGFSELRQLGFFGGPVFAGFILNYSSSFLMFSISAVVIIFAGILFRIGRR